MDTNQAIQQLQQQLQALTAQVNANKQTDKAQQVSANYHAHTGFDGSSKLDLQKQKRFNRTGLVDQSTILVDASLGNWYYVKLAGNRTLSNPTGAADGQKIIFEFIQDGTGSRTITLGSKFTFGTSIPSITLTTTANKRDFLGVIYSQPDDKYFVQAFTQGF